VSDMNNSNRAPRLPDFIAVGPPRTATTWMHEVLKDHACLPADRKETDFFTRFYDRGMNWYADYFRHCDGPVRVGELSPMYFASNTARERIAKDLPNCKIICSFRDPVERAYSHYRMMRRIAVTNDDFESVATRRGELLESTRYGTYLAHWFHSFGRERVLALIYDDLEDDPQAFLDSVCDFIGLARFSVSASEVGSKRVNLMSTQPPNPRLAKMARNLVDWFVSRRYSRAAKIVRQSAIIKYLLEGGAPFPPLAPDIAARMREYCRPEVEKLEGLIGRDLFAWKTGMSFQNSSAR
jgi:hypothetical protein